MASRNITQTTHMLRQQKFNLKSETTTGIVAVITVLEQHDNFRRKLLHIKHLEPKCFGSIASAEIMLEKFYSYDVKSRTATIVIFLNYAMVS